MHVLTSQGVTALLGLACRLYALVWNIHVSNARCKAQQPQSARRGVCAPR